MISSERNSVTPECFPSCTWRETHLRATSNPPGALACHTSPKPPRPSSFWRTYPGTSSRPGCRPDMFAGALGFIVYLRDPNRNQSCYYCRPALSEQFAGREISKRHEDHFFASSLFLHFLLGLSPLRAEQWTAGRSLAL